MARSIAAADRTSPRGRRGRTCEPPRPQRSRHDARPMELELHDKVCVVTGASSGIGLETARRLCAERANVLMVARDAERLEEAAAECGAKFLAADVTEPGAHQRIVATCAEQMGGVDVLVNNAGTSFARPLEELTDDDWQGQ